MTVGVNNKFLHKEATMSQEIKADVKLNLEGLLCPIPVVKVSQAIKNLAVGGILEATATDPGVLADIPAWAKSTGNEVLSMERQSKVITFLIKKVK
jgi:tRNA 2-thiouridine synthesizing protein A